MRTVSAALLILAACGGGKAATFDAPAPDGRADAAPPDATPDSAIDAAPAGTAHTFAMDRILLPTQSGDGTKYGLDLDGDGNVDNALGNVLIAVTAAVSGTGDFQATEDAAIASQAVIDLVDVQATDLTDAVDVGLTEYEGAPVTGSGVEVAAGSPTDSYMLGTISASAFAGGPGRATLTLVLFDSAPITVTLRGARSTIGSVSSSGLASGVLAGAITQDDMNATVLPAIAAGISAQFAHDCTVGGTPPSCGCAPGSRGAAWDDIFDRSPQDCRITADEVVNNNLISTLFEPDVQLPPATGQPPTPCFSVGVGFTAKPASFTPPP